MAKALTVGCDPQRLSAVNAVLRAHGYHVRGADCPSTVRHLLSLEPFQFVAIIDSLPGSFSEALGKELQPGRICPRLIHAEGLQPEEMMEMFTQGAHRANAA